MKIKQVLMIAAVILAMLVVPVAADEAPSTTVSVSSAAGYYILIPTAGVDLTTGTAFAEAGIQMKTLAPGSVIELSVESGNNFVLIHTYDPQYTLEYNMTAGGVEVESGDLILAADANNTNEQIVNLEFEADTTILPAAGNYKDTLTFVAEEHVPINGKPAEIVSTLPELLANEKYTTKAGGYFVLHDDVTGGAAASSGYGVTGVVVEYGTILDGNGHTLSVSGADTTWACAIAAKGGTIKDLTINSGFRGIFMPGATGDVYIENVVIDGPVYTFNSDAGSKDYGVYISDSTLKGWTSFSDVHKEVIFTNCIFGEGSGYAFCRPYNACSFIDCEFEAGFEVDARAACTFKDCNLGGVPITTENIATLVTSGSEKATVVA